VRVYLIKKYKESVNVNRQTERQTDKHTHTHTQRHGADGRDGLLSQDVTYVIRRARTNRRVGLDDDNLLQFDRRIGRRLVTARCVRTVDHKARGLRSALAVPACTAVPLQKDKSFLPNMVAFK